MTIKYKNSVIDHYPYSEMKVTKPKKDILDISLIWYYHLMDYTGLLKKVNCAMYFLINLANLPLDSHARKSLQNININLLKMVHISF